jgi:putative sugar O-methyltransferase
MNLELLSRPIGAAKKARARIAAHLRMRAFASHGRRLFRDDPRYDLKNVSDGFASRIDDRNDDAEILERICAAYRKAEEEERMAPEQYQPPEPWQQIRRRNLGPVITALKEQDIPALRRMYRSFYRDACSTGILGAPNGQPRAYFAPKIKDAYRHFYLSHVLYRLNYWKSITGGEHLLRDLEGPGVGNPFGVVIDGTHICVGAEYAHYCSRRLDEELGTGNATVAEIRAGFGGIAYYLLRDRPKTTYVDFDYPESIALASYYLMKSFPKLRFLCYGEKAVTGESIRSADVVMLPFSELKRVPSKAMTLTFTSHGLAALRRESVSRCLQDVGRMTAEKILLIGNRGAAELASGAGNAASFPFALHETRESGWHSYKVSGAGVGGAAGLRDAAVVEQSYIRIAAPAQRAPGNSSPRTPSDKALVLKWAPKVRR